MRKFHAIDKWIIRLHLKFQVKIFIRSKVMKYTVMYGIQKCSFEIKGFKDKFPTPKYRSARPLPGGATQLRTAL